MRVLVLTILFLSTATGCNNTVPSKSDIDTSVADLPPASACDSTIVLSQSYSESYTDTSVADHAVATKVRPSPSPRLWQDEIMASFIKVAYAKETDTVYYVFRWEHGDLQGSVELDADTEPVTHDMSVTANNLPSLLKEDNVEDISGVLLVRTRKLQDSSQLVLDVRIDEVYQVHFSDGRAFTNQRNSREGRVKLGYENVPGEPQHLGSGSGSSSGSEASFQMLKWQEGQDVPWLSLELKELGSTPAKNDDSQ